MVAAFRTLARGLRHLNDRSSIYVAANLIAFVLFLPIITAPAAWAGLVKMSLLSQTTPTAGPGDMWNAFRAHLRQGLVLALLNILVIGINVWNLANFWAVPGVFYAVLRGVWLLVLLVWFAVQVYFWPLYFNMAKPTLVGALRNAFVMVLLNPIYTLVLLIAFAIIVAASTLLMIPWALLSISVLAALSTTAVLERLEAAGFRDPPPPPPEEFSPIDLS